MVEKLDKNGTTENRSAFGHLPTISRALPPLPFPREELKKDYVPLFTPRNESHSNRPSLASTRLRDFATFRGGKNG